ncbi:MAG: hypothetical protein R2705_04590 [Ilumatobacteraceae bacterium]
MPLLLPLFEAGLRFRLRGLASTWVVVTLVNLVAQFEDTYQFDPQSFAARSSLLLVVAAPAAFISQLLMEELVIQAGNAEADRRNEVTGVVAEAVARMQTFDRDEIAAVTVTAAQALLSVEAELRRPDGTVCALGR